MYESEFSLSISSSYLYKSLLRISNVITNKPLVPILEDFFFEINEDVLKVTASDNNTTIYSFIGLDSKFGNFNIAIPSKIILETLKNLPEQPIKIINDPVKNVVTIESLNGKYEIMCDDPKKYKVLDIDKEGKWFSLKGDTLIESIENTIIVSSSDPLKPVLNSILFEINNNNLITVATDIHRLIKYVVHLDSPNENIKFIIPKRALTLLKNILIQEEIRFYITEKYIYLESGSDVFITALINEDYPDYERVIPKNYQNRLFINRMELLGALKRLTIYTSCINYQIKFNLSQNRLKLIADDLNSENKGVEEIQCNYECKNLTISFNIKYLLEVLQNIKTDIVIMEFADPNENNITNKASVIRPFQNSNDTLSYESISLVSHIFM